MEPITLTESQTSFLISFLKVCQKADRSGGNSYTRIMGIRLIKTWYRCTIAEARVIVDATLNHPYFVYYS